MDPAIRHLDMVVERSLDLESWLPIEAAFEERELSEVASLLRIRPVAQNPDVRVFYRLKAVR